jgi:hypothetical protein
MPLLLDLERGFGNEERYQFGLACDRLYTLIPIPLLDKVLK